MPKTGCSEGLGADPRKNPRSRGSGRERGKGGRKSRFRAVLGAVAGKGAKVAVNRVLGRF